jgi:hypothetical protein
MSDRELFIGRLERARVALDTLLLDPTTTEAASGAQ